MRRRFSILAVAALVALTTACAASGGTDGTDATSSRTGTAYRTTVFVRGAPIHGANGLAVDGDRLLVASAIGGELVVLDRNTGTILDRLGHAAGVDAPDDVVVGPDGSVYWTDIQIGEVGRRTPDGQVTKQKVAPGMNPIAFSSTGRLFVAQAFMGDGLYELDPNLVKAPRVVVPDSGKAPFLTQLNGFAFGPDGMLYAPQPFLGRIVRIDPDTGAMTTVVDKLAEPPTSVEFDAQGRLYASLRYGTVVQVDVEQHTTSTYATIKDGVLDNLAFDHDGRLYVSDSDSGAVHVVATDGAVSTLSRGGLILPNGLVQARSASGQRVLYVADVWTLQRYDARTGALLGADRMVRTPDSIVEPWSVAPDNGDVVVTSWMSNAVQVWDPAAGKPVQRFDDFAVPVNAIRFRGDLVVAQLGNQAAGVPPGVVRQAADGERTVLTDRLTVPSGLAANRHDLWAADWATGKVWQLVRDGSTLRNPRLVAKGLQHPEGLAVARGGSLLVVESGSGRLLRVDPRTHRTSVLARRLATGQQGSVGSPPAYAMAGVAVGPAGSLFVSGDRGDVVYKLTPRS